MQSPSIICVREETHAHRALVAGGHGGGDGGVLAEEVVWG